MPRRQAGDRRAYERVETEPGLDHYIRDPKGKVYMALKCKAVCFITTRLDWLGT